MDGAMIRAVVLSSDSPADLAHTLGDLVPGAVEGVVKRVIVAASADADEVLFEVTDDAGASFKRLEGPLGARAAAACASGDWLLVIEAGTRLSSHWHAGVGNHLRTRPEQAAVMQGDRAGLFSAREVLALIVPRSAYDKAGGFKTQDADLKPLLRRLGRAGRVARL
jgi:hypothetical protein